MTRKSKGRKSLEEDFQAKSSKAPKESRRRTVRELLKMDPTAEGFRLNVDSLGVEGGQVQVSGDLPHRSQDGPCREGMGVVRSTGSLLQVVQGITQSCKRAQQESSRSPGVCEKDPPSKSRVVEDQGGVRLRTLPFGHGLDVEGD